MLMKKFRDIDHAKYKVGQLVVESALVAWPDPTGSTGRGKRSCGLTRPNRLSQLKRSLDVELAITRRSWEFRADINTSLDTAMSLCHRLRLFSYLDRHVSLVLLLHSNSLTVCVILFPWYSLPRFPYVHVSICVSDGRIIRISVNLSVSQST